MKIYVIYNPCNRPLTSTSTTQHMYGDVFLEIQGVKFLSANIRVTVVEEPEHTATALRLVDATHLEPVKEVIRRIYIPNDLHVERFVSLRIVEGNGNEAGHSTENGLTEKAFYGRNKGRYAFKFDVRLLSREGHEIEPAMLTPQHCVPGFLCHINPDSPLRIQDQNRTPTTSVAARPVTRGLVSLPAQGFTFSRHASQGTLISLTPDLSRNVMNGSSRFLTPVFSGHVTSAPNRFLAPSRYPAPNTFRLSSLLTPFVQPAVPGSKRSLTSDIPPTTPADKLVAVAYIEIAPSQETLPAAAAAGTSQHVATGSLNAAAASIPMGIQETADSSGLSSLPTVAKAITATEEGSDDVDIRLALTEQAVEPPEDAEVMTGEYAEKESGAVQGDTLPTPSAPPPRTRIAVIEASPASTSRVDSPADETPLPPDDDPPPAAHSQLFIPRRRDPTNVDNEAERADTSSPALPSTSSAGSAACSGVRLAENEEPESSRINAPPAPSPPPTLSPVRSDDEDLQEILATFTSVNEQYASQTPVTEEEERIAEFEVEGFLACCKRT